MSDCDVSAMEEWMAQPMPVYCVECGWFGLEDELDADGKCPVCTSIKIKIDK